MPENETVNLLTFALPFLIAGIISAIATPFVIKFSYYIGALDVPKDARRMHKKPIPRLGGIAIFSGFLISLLCFAKITPRLNAMLIGAIIIVLMGIIDDIHPLKASLKLVVQIIAACIPVFSGTVITFMTNVNIFNEDLYINLGFLSIPVTILWIVGVTNAVNLIDGLDGLAAGVSSIASISVFVICLLTGHTEIALILAILTGASFGFMPYNINPAKIFMGDTGATFLGYILAVISVEGLFKFYTIISFFIPFLILGLPIFDTSFAILRRISHGQSPMTADRGHIHHKLIDAGFSQKQSVAILYSLSAMLGLLAVLLTLRGKTKLIGFIFVIACIIMLLVSIKIMSRHHHNTESGAADGKSDVPGDTEPAAENADTNESGKKNADETDEIK